ncbi:SusC/RagA family TonB-linked outer membrane protein [Pedobacter frigiditerrae]|uniref:SusC/RagA family TonB-linked outer membrane protein n=1 Tax=Pedobacter frigiditerrae TaxID=2530452 RepID=A0A4R0MXZ5_9SPHI|nr:SusC/RagA family TonB-linked outer membrane protein [Pedobacter frigiditerrae]TCC92168.1 SusC/RagA family TonB-linked outer membrane protein [Pedobacter frigiditerrae]
MKVFYPIKLCMLMIFALCTLTTYAQTGSISGKINDDANLPIPGASVQVVGTQKITSTDNDGNYRITGLTSGTYTLTVKYIGFATQTLTATVGNGNAVLNFNMKTDSQNLNEVVVIGYGTAEKKSLTGSITTVNSKDFQKGTITTPEQLIQGKVAGVNIINNGGRPGGGSVIRIRGGASLNASNDPLIVVDGIPFSGNSIGNAPSPLSLINPNDIETFTVLKDANATAIYGSRASNGVILITTKKGGSGAPIFNFSTNNSIATVIKNVDVLSADQIKAYVNVNGTTAQKALLGGANTNWQDEIFQNAFSTDNALSMAGSFKNVPYRVSAGYLEQQGLLITDKLERATGALTIAPTFFSNHLKVNLNLKGSLSESHFANDGAIASAIQFDPTQPVYANNAFGGYYEWIQGSVPNPNAPRNPVALIRLQDNNGKAARSFGNLQLDYSFHFLPELHANLNLAYDVNKGYGYTRVGSIAAQSASTSGFYGNRLNTERNKISEFYLNYAHTAASIKSKFDVTLGYGYYDNSSTGYNFQTFKGTGELLNTPVFPFSIEQNKLLSYYGRFVYTLADKYILSGTMRADASSKFAEENRWGYFPSAGFTWRIIGEDFMKDSKTFSDLKLRLSYGETGNKDGIGNYDYLSKYYANSNTGQYQIGNTFYNYYTPAAYDPDLKWESTTTYNAGLDYGFAKGRIYGSIDAYYKKTKDLLSTINIPVGTNFSNLLTTNVGNMEVKGIEGSINFAAIKSENPNWDFGFNIAYNKRKVTNLTLNPDPGSKVGAGDITGGVGTTLKYNSVNQIPGSFFVYKQVYNASGTPIEGVYTDLNADGVINTSDQYFYKSPDPNFTFGFNTAFSHKKWTISTVLRANLGNYIYDNVSSNFGIKTNILSPSGIINNTNSDFLNTNFQSNQFLSDYYIKNASFLKMDNLGIAYNVGRLSKNGKTNMRISANCQNVFVVTNYDGLDPELSSGIDYNLYPRPRTYTLGLNVGF